MKPLQRIRLHLGTLAAAALLAGPGTASAQGAPIRIGSIKTLEGTFATAGQDAVRALTMAFEEANYTVAGRKIEWIRESSNAQADVALARARKLVEQDNVDIIIGPLSGAEGIALRDYSRTLKGRTIVNGQSAAADTTMRDPSPNFFRFNGDGMQWIAGLGNYTYNTLKARHVAVVAGDYAFPYAQVFGFMQEFCKAGGKVTKLWSPLGTSDFASTIARIPKNADAVLVLHGGTDALAFLTQYAQAGGTLPLVAGSVTADQVVMSARGPHRRLLNGLITAGPLVDDSDDPTWKAFVERYRKRFPDGFTAPSINAVHYYIAAKATLMALEQVKGDLTNDQKAFQAALAKLTVPTPMGGKVRLDENRQAIADNFIRKIVERDGKLYTTQVQKFEAVSQTLGMPRDQFMALGSPSRDNPNCPPPN
ncbi:MAG TPA: ABC transporter substrate-binding protein [Ramlibacter sp.]|nr:ABC transporter substrate-binding protein [Ramlibacter sp.]